MTTLIPKIDLKNGGLTPSGAINRPINEKIQEIISVEDFGAVGDGTTDDTIAIQAAFDALANNGSINFVEGKIYKTTSELILNPNLLGILIQGNSATINAAHNGNGLDITATNQNYSRHTINNLNITGPNVAYPANPTQLAGTSTGAALKIGPDDTTNTAGGYLVSINNCRFQQFYQGIYLQNALLCNFNGGYIAFNQYGIYVDSGQTNANTFNNVNVRENRIFGIYSSDRTGGSLSFATANVFYGCTIETNIPYDSSAGGYPSTFDGTKGFGVKIWNSYDWLFDGCYFENHNYSVMISSSSDDNQFRNCRFAGGGAANVRSAGIYFDGGSLSNNAFQNCKLLSNSTTIPNVTWDNPSTCFYNQFLDNIGFVFDTANLGARTFIRNNRLIQGTGLGGQNYGVINMPFQGLAQNPDEGTTPGTITGIGTATATLNIFGKGEVFFDSNISGNTTITSFNGAANNSVLVLINNQATYSVTVDLFFGSSAIVFNAAYQTAMIYINYQGRAFLIGKNF